MVYSLGTSLDLQGNMEPVRIEAHGEAVAVFGRLPSDLDGYFIRNGPNPQLVSTFEQPYHAFNGSGMVHVTEIKDGTATYLNRWVKTKRFEHEKEHGKTLKQMESFDEDGVFMGTANTAMVYHANKLLALLEADRPYERPIITSMHPLALRPTAIG